MPRRRPKGTSLRLSTGLAGSRLSPGNCEPPPASRTCGEISIALRRRARFWNQSTAASAKASRQRTSKGQKACWRNCPWPTSRLSRARVHDCVSESL